jgi:hypothetical protein
MKKFLIEVPHGADQNACEEAIRIFLSTGSHFMTNAEWGCKDGEHKAWIILEIDSKEDAMYILPPAYRRSAKVVELTRFTSEEMFEKQPYHP